MFGFDPITILASLLPVAVQGISRVIDHFTGGATPQSVDEQIKLNDSEVSKLQALAQLDVANSNDPVWVSVLRDLQRPMVVYIVLLLFTGTITYWSFTGQVSAPALLDILGNMTSAVIFYLFGQRVLVKMR